MPSSPAERTLQNAEIDVDDANVAASYAYRFNRNQRVPLETAADATVQVVSGDGAPRVRVAAAIACEVISSSHPSMIPVGGFCTLAPYSDKEVQKYVFDGVSDEFSEVPQAFFHYTAFASGGKEFLCDIQGVE